MRPGGSDGSTPLALGLPPSAGDKGADEKERHHEDRRPRRLPAAPHVRAMEGLDHASAGRPADSFRIMCCGCARASIAAGPDRIRRTDRSRCSGVPTSPPSLCSTARCRGPRPARPAPGPGDSVCGSAVVGAWLIMLAAAWGWWGNGSSEDLAAQLQCGGGRHSSGVRVLLGRGQSRAQRPESTDVLPIRARSVEPWHDSSRPRADREHRSFGIGTSLASPEVAAATAAAGGVLTLARAFRTPSRRGCPAPSSSPSTATRRVTTSASAVAFGAARSKSPTRVRGP